ncbi:MAG: hypothetical protein ACXW2C_11010 [Acidimicrobiia bacterium]
MRIRLPLWTHQLVEYLLAVLIVTQSVNAGKAATFMAVTGGLLFVVAATTDASMGALHWIPPQLHRALDVLVIAALIAAPILSGTTDPIGWALCFFAAAALIWLHWHTHWSRAAGRADSTPATSPGPTKAATLGESTRNLGKTVDRTTRGASRAAGRICGRARAQRPTSGEKPDRNT